MTTKQPSARDIERALGAELLAELRGYTQRSTEFLELLAGQTVNRVLEVWSGTFPSDGIISREYQVAAGCIKVLNLSEDPTHTVTVSSAGPAATAPTGLGTWPILGGCADTIPLASRQVTLYGTSGDIVAIQVYTAALQPVTLAPGVTIVGAA